MGRGSIHYSQAPPAISVITFYHQLDNEIVFGKKIQDSSVESVADPNKFNLG